MTAPPRQSRLGWFVPFMNAWGRADEPTRKQVEATVQAYAERLITGETLSERIAGLLGLAIPVSRS